MNVVTKMTLIQMMICILPRTKFNSSLLLHLQKQIFLFHQIGIYSIFDIGYQCKELSREYPGIAYLPCYKKNPSRTPTTYNHCTLCKTQSPFWKKFGIQGIIEKQHSSKHRYTTGTLDYHNICTTRKGFQTNFEMYQHFNKKSNSVPMHLLLLKCLE